MFKMKIDDAGENVTLEVCQMYQELKINCIWNDGKDLILIEKEKELPSGNLKTQGIKKIFITDYITSLEELAMHKKQRRSAMRLVNTSYFKVSKGKIDYFIKERSYVSKFDGDIVTEFITEETFNKNLEDGKKVEFYNYENAPSNIKRKIEGNAKVQCPKCNREVGKIKKHKILDCKCDAKLMCIEIKKELILLDLKNYKGEK